MNIVATVLKAVGEVLIINIILIPTGFSPYVALWYSLIVLLAFLLRFAMNKKKTGLWPWGEFIEQSIYTLSWSFFASLVWFKLYPTSQWFEVYLFLNSLFASFLVGELEHIMSVGFRPWLKNCLLKFVATETKKEEEK